MANISCDAWHEEAVSSKLVHIWQRTTVLIIRGMPGLNAYVRLGMAKLLGLPRMEKIYIEILSYNKLVFTGF